MSDMKTALASAEEFIKQAASASGERAAELRDKSLNALRQAKEKAQDIQDTVTQTSRQAARAADDYVHAYPWKAVSIAAGIGLVVGLILNRK